MHRTLSAALALLGTLATPTLYATEQTAPEALARGLMLFHEGRMIFSPCRERSYVEVEDVSPGAAVSAALRKIGLAADKPLYTELFGEAAGGMLRVSAINFAHGEARCGAAVRNGGSWQAVGRDPTWSMSTAGDRMRLHVEGRPAVESSFAEKRGDATPSRLAIETDIGRWELRRQPCYSSDYRWVSGWSISGNIRNQALRGCAWQP
ncbi:MAG: hypothetical protein AB7U81_04515 [Thiohalomonadaceae bacterium]